MKKFTITIEETVSASFAVDANSIADALKIADEKYKNCEFVLEPGELINLRIEEKEDNLFPL